MGSELGTMRASHSYIPDDDVIVGGAKVAGIKSSMNRSRSTGICRMTDLSPDAATAMFNILKSSMTKRNEKILDTPHTRFESRPVSPASLATWTTIV